MSEKKYEFEYVVLHYRHDLLTGEFLNVGLALYSKSTNFFQCQFINKYKRITATFPGSNGEFVRSYLNHLQHTANKIIKHWQKTENINELLPKYGDSIGKIVESILPYDDSSIYFGEPIYGICDNPEQMFISLFQRLVEYYNTDKVKQTRDDKEIWSKYKSAFNEHEVLNFLEEKTIKIKDWDYKFEHTWKNGKVNILNPISFDLQNPERIQNKAERWYGRSMLLGDSPEIGSLYHLLGNPNKDDKKQYKAYQNAKDILYRKNDKFPIEIIEENEAEDFVNNLIQKIDIDIQHNQLDS